MKRLAILMLACLGLAMLVGGCNDTESNPYFSRVRVSPSCGVAPLRVEGYAIASGGNETGDPTGGNNNLDVVWNFGDGETATSTLVYHTYRAPGRYRVTLTATDPDGQVATFPGPNDADYIVNVMADSLIVRAETNFPDGTVTTDDTVNFNFLAEACGLDPENPEDYSKLTFHWATFDVDSVNFRVRSPSYRFVTPGEHFVRLRVSYPGIAVTRYDSLYIQVIGF